MKSLPIVRGLIFGAVLSFPAMVMAETDNSAIEKLVSELATKPEHHKALADYYTSKAGEAKKEADHHLKMKQSYVGISKSSTSPAVMSSHCDKIISNYESLANEYEQLAKEHLSQMK